MQILFGLLGAFTGLLIAKYVSGKFYERKIAGFYMHEGRLKFEMTDGWGRFLP